MGRVTRHLTKLQSTLRVAPRRVTGIYGLAPRRCVGLRDNAMSVSMDMLRRVSRTCKIRLAALVFNSRPGVDDCFVAHGKGNVTIRQAGTCGCRSLTTKFINQGTSPFVIAIRPTPSKAPVCLGSRPKRRCGVMLGNHVLLRVGGGRLVLRRNSDVCFGSRLPRKVGTLSKRGIDFLTVVLWVSGLVVVLREFVGGAAFRSRRSFVGGFGVGIPRGFGFKCSMMST